MTCCPPCPLATRSPSRRAALHAACVFCGLTGRAPGRTRGCDGATAYAVLRQAGQRATRPPPHIHTPAGGDGRADPRGACQWHIAAGRQCGALPAGARGAGQLPQFPIACVARRPRQSHAQQAPQHLCTPRAQVTGLRFWHRGTRLLGVARLLPGGATAELANATSYNIVSTSYQLGGGDGYSSFKAAPFLFPSGDPMDILLLNELRAKAPNAVHGLPWC